MCSFSSLAFTSTAACTSSHMTTMRRTFGKSAVIVTRLNSTRKFCHDQEHFQSYNEISIFSNVKLPHPSPILGGTPLEVSLKGATDTSFDQSCCISCLAVDFGYVTMQAQLGEILLCVDKIQGSMITEKTCEEKNGSVIYLPPLKLTPLTTTEHL